jgi:hypothetical protein
MILPKVSYLVPLFRKIATILLLTFLFFNWVGYWLFLSWFQSRESARLEARLDSDQYDEGQLVLIRISAAAVPYSTPSTSFERADGGIEIGDIHYRFVRKRLYNDSIELLCLPDKEYSRLRTAKNDILRLTAGIPATKQNRSTPTGKAPQVLLKVFCQKIPAFCISNFPAAGIRSYSYQETAIQPGHIRIGKQPPRLSANLFL